MILSDTILYGTNNNMCIMGKVNVNSLPSQSEIRLFDADTMSVEYIVHSLDNGNYIMQGLIPKNYIISASDINDRFVPVLKFINSQDLTNIFYSEQKEYYDLWMSGNDTLPVEYNVALSLNTPKSRYAVYDYHGTDTLSMFIEGAETLDTHIIELIYSSNIIYTTSSQTLITIPNISLHNISSIKYDNKIQMFDINYHTNMKPGYITGSVNNSCDGTDFKIRVYREDGFFIGDYDIAENGSYEIPNLNVHSSYDVLLYDLNLAVETQVNSRRIPTAYSVTE